MVDAAVQSAMRVYLEPTSVAHLSHDIGIINRNDQFEAIITAGTPLPVKRHRLIERDAEHCRVNLMERSTSGDIQPIAQLTLIDLGLPAEENQRVYFDITVRENGATQLTLRCPHSNKRVHGELPAPTAANTEISVI
jgi:hypothetical protein